jgi:hypothetical protein
VLEFAPTKVNKGELASASRRKTFHNFVLKTSRISPHSQ